MILKKKITISWSGGKDSALALFKIIGSGEYDIQHLHTIIDSKTKRVGLHGVREELVELQAKSLQIPLVKVYLQSSEDLREYENLVKALYKRFHDEGVTHILFGDIFLEDLKLYRETLLKESGLIPLYPLWQERSEKLIFEFLDCGFKTILCSTNEKCFQVGLLGKVISRKFIKLLPDGTDPCGENGEFHTFVFDGPIFKKRLSFKSGGVMSREYSYSVKVGDLIENRKSFFYFQELLV
jgi:uncharacterized protein (TIGR00290 family)